MTTQGSLGVFLRLAARGAAFLALIQIATPGSALGQQADRPSEAGQATAPAYSVAARQRFLDMFARAYFPGRTAQLLYVPHEGEFVTRPFACRRKEVASNRSRTFRRRDCFWRNRRSHQTEGTSTTAAATAALRCGC